MIMKPEQLALNEAIKTGDIPAIAAALASGADVNYLDSAGLHDPPLVTALAYDSDYPELSEGTRLSVVRFLVERGANVNFPGDDGCRPLFYAALGWNDSIFDYLLSCGADPNFLMDNDAESLFDSLIFDWRFDFFDLDEPESPLEGEDNVDWLSRIAAKNGKPQPRILQMLKAAGAKRHHELRG